MSRHGGREDAGFREDYYTTDNRNGGHHLQPPQPLQRPRSVPPPSAAVVERNYMMTPATHSHSRARSRSRSRSRHRGGARRSRSRGRDGPVERAEKAVKSSFTSSNSGLGIGILGAIVGGLAARHASDSAPKHHHGSSREYDKERDQRMLVSTIVGAAVGGLGANAIERRLEIDREKKNEASRGRTGRRDKDDHYHHHHPHHHHSRHGDVDHFYDHVYDERSVRRRRSVDDSQRRPYHPLDYRP